MSLSRGPPTRRIGRVVRHWLAKPRSGCKARARSIRASSARRCHWGWAGVWGLGCVEVVLGVAAERLARAPGADGLPPAPTRAAPAARLPAAMADMTADSHTVMPATGHRPGCARAAIRRRTLGRPAAPSPATPTDAGHQLRQPPITPPEVTHRPRRPPATPPEVTHRPRRPPATPPPSAEQSLQHRRDPVVLVGGRHLVRHRLELLVGVGHRHAAGSPGEHRDVVGHVAEGDRVR
jgi:hypothetical protein